jgi:hypothetical protein
MVNICSKTGADKCPEINWRNGSLNDRPGGVKNSRMLISIEAVERGPGKSAIDV